MKTFSVRKIGGKGKSVSVLTVPAEIAKRLDPSLEFVCELTEEGLLYRPVEKREPELPAWVKPRRRS